MLQEVVVRPWRDTAELLEVRSLLYASDATGYDEEETARRKRLGVSIVHTWKRRSQIPHSIYSTALLVDAATTHRDLVRAHEIVNSSPASPPTTASSSAAATEPAKPSYLQYNPLTARSLYATAIARFVTGFCDTAQTSSGPKRNMYDVAAELEMPAHWVEMRHEITHGEMPSVDDMQDVSREAVQWLWRGYWARLADGRKKAAVEKDEDEGRKEVDVRAALKALLKARKASIRAGREDANAEEARQVVAAARGDKGLKVVARILVADKTLLPSLKTADLNMKAAFLIWDTPLHSLLRTVPSFYHHLVTALQTSLVADSRSNPTSDLSHDATFQWLTHILLSPPWSSPRRAADSSRDISTSVMEFTLVNPTFWTAKLRRTLLESGDSAFQSNWASLDSASLKLEYGAELIDNTGATIDDLMKSVDLDVRLMSGRGGTRGRRSASTEMRAASAGSSARGGAGATLRHGSAIPPISLDDMTSGDGDIGSRSSARNTDGVSDDDKALPPTATTGGKNTGGWKLWEGPWTPRPIGVCEAPIRGSIPGFS